ncbi:MAG: hypothetical protein A4E28_01186 [Methanocella sp. PtaU1.Bin125]|nr:MAG: hypothetical protein A4E28_01186 [Methanocella sp. PtaU1.Bin125]
MELRDLEKMGRCPNCGKEAIQVIEAKPGETVVTCMNCGAARHYDDADEGVGVQATFDDALPKG